MRKVQRLSLSSFKPAVTVSICIFSILCAAVSSAQQTPVEETPAAKVRRQRVTAPIPTPPGYKGPPVQRFRGFKKEQTPAADGTAGAVAASEGSAPGLPKPAQIAAAPVSDKAALKVSWKRIKDNATTLTLERAEAEDGPFFAVAIVSGGETSFEDSNAVYAGSTYYYRLIAQYDGYDGGLVSPVSLPVTLPKKSDSLDSKTSDGESTASKSGDGAKAN